MCPPFLMNESAQEKFGSEDGDLDENAKISAIIKTAGPHR